MGEKSIYQVKGFGFNAQPVKKVRRGKREESFLSVKSFCTASTDVTE